MVGGKAKITCLRFRRVTFGMADKYVSAVCEIIAEVARALIVGCKYRCRLSEASTNMQVLYVDPMILFLMRAA